MRYEDPVLALIADLYGQIVALTAENERLRQAVASLDVEQPVTPQP